VQTLLIFFNGIAYLKVRSSEIKEEIFREQKWKGDQIKKTRD